MAAANDDGLDVERGLGSGVRRPGAKRGAEGRRIFDQQPVAGRHEGDPLVSGKVQVTTRGKLFCCSQSRSSSVSEFLPVRAENAPAAARKFAGEFFDCSASQRQIEAGNRFDRRDFVQGFERPGGLSADAAVGVAVQTARFRRRRETVAGAGREGEGDFALGDGNFRKRLAEQVNFGVRSSSTLRSRATAEDGEFGVGNRD